MSSEVLTTDTRQIRTPKEEVLIPADRDRVLSTPIEQILKELPYTKE